MAGDRMQIDGAMRLRAMQENSDGGNGDVSERQRNQHIAPPRQIPTRQIEQTCQHVFVPQKR